MAEKLTPQQEMAVHNRGGKLLVSAAAGSGKTKVLVDRLMSYLLDPVAPANLDEFLIITYTKAAASELRGKIASKLSEKMAQNPENRHLQRQMQRLYLTKITTVHSFCADILREYAYLLDLPADLRVADENECNQIRENTMKKCLDEAYSQSEDPDFRAFVDSQGLGRDDRLVPEILMKVYDGARCHLDPEGWLQQCVQNADTSRISDTGQTVWGEYLIKDLQGHLAMQIVALEQCVALAGCVDNMEKPVALLLDTIRQLRDLRDAKSWDEIVALGDIDYGRLTFSKKCTDEQLCQQIKAVRSACKASVDKRLRAFADPSSVVLEDLARSASAVRGMVKLVGQFGDEYDRAKRMRRVLDFGDLEHKMLDLLYGKSRTGRTAAATEIGNRFREIMVDEYQDSNGVQDAIFSALTEQRQNCFMVGDVKQSIYQFRLADPGIFLEKYNTYAHAETAEDPVGRKVMLSRNFRSGGGVLAGANDVFRTCMSPAVGGLTYGDEEALVEGIPHTPLGEPEVELWAIPVEESTYEEEAAFVARRIQELTDGTHFVRSGDELRPIQIGDVAILLRSPGSVGGYYKNALATVGIPCTTGGGNDLLQEEEIAVIRALLQTISNPRQDIPLLAALTNRVFCVTAEELARTRGKKHGGCIYDALLASDNPKIKEFLQYLSVWRREARIQPLAQLLESIFAMTRLDSIFAAMPDGDVRKRNIETFYQLADDFEKTGRRDLEQFLDHLDALEGKGLISQGSEGAGNAVTLMSIHKSKGLEFPVVFVCGLSRAFNRESTRAQVLCDQELGLGLAAVDEKNRVRYPTIAKRAIAAKITADSLSEEMRVLYVALTRARDRLIMTYASQTLEKDLQDIVCRMDMGDRDLLTKDATCSGQWVLMTALRRTEAGELFALGGKPSETALGEPVWRIGVETAVAQTGGHEVTEEHVTAAPADMLEKLRAGLEFSYPYLSATRSPSKQTATQRKGREKDTEVNEHVPLKRTTGNLRKASFAAAPSDGAALGTATHAVMQYIRYEQCTDETGVQQEIDRLVLENFITKEQAQLVDCRQIAAFFATPIGKQLQHHTNVLREFKFSILDDATHYDPSLVGEEIFLQGVVDCAMVDVDGITVIDFKTDFVTEETISEKTACYRPQVEAYADAMGRIYQLPVKESWLYFFRLNRFVKV
ncbi:MAG: helicase-exonuclease AddAB subunit AddA [Ruminococcaceae bacterium]|nr:helicase-exonuclease AddAB subunit AddA [Oscillospiraceae bacterium]